MLQHSAGALKPDPVLVVQFFIAPTQEVLCLEVMDDKLMRLQMELQQMELVQMELVQMEFVQMELEQMEFVQQFNGKG